MALRSPDPGQFIQKVVVNGYSHYYSAYSTLAGYMQVGGYVDLVAEPSNLHDKNAVKVCFKGHQVGWVPKTENREIARRLKAGEKLRAEITHHAPHNLQLDVYVEPKAVQHTLESDLKPFATVEITGRPSQDPNAFHRISAFIPGACFPLSSFDRRSSISLVDPYEGRDLTWFRKSELPERNADTITELANRGQLVAVKRSDGLFDLHQKGREPKAPAPLKYVTENLPCQASAPGITYGNSATITQPTTTKKENTMMNFAQTTTSLINNNKSAAAQAGYLEAGRIANNQFTKLAAKSLPMMLRGYADTAVGKLVIANIAQMAAAQLRPQDATLAKLTGAMTVAAYQGVIQTVDIEGWLNELLGSPEIKRAMDKLNVSDSGSVASGTFNSDAAGRPGAL